MGVGAGELELLILELASMGIKNRDWREQLTLVGRSAPIISEVFWVGRGPPGGGGGTAIGPAIALDFSHHR